MSDNRPQYEQAYEDYKNGLKTKEIAAKYNVSDATVRSWKNRYWNKKTLQQKSKNVATDDKKRCNGKRSAGAPEGNKNALGNSGGAPLNNKNNRKHGIYEKLMYETMSDEEKELLHDLDMDEEAELRLTIRLCDVEVARLLKLMKEARDKPGGLFIHGVSKTENRIVGQTAAQHVTTNTISSNDIMLRYRAEIQKYMKQKVRCIEALIKKGYSMNKLELELLKAQAAVKPEEQAENEENQFIGALEDATRGTWPDE